ncbi:MAG: phosphate ABC transporter ATP-binding protein, partial [Candidatus Ranarchaeia archaeon]
PENKVTAIMGPSGCGKTSLLRTVNRLQDLEPAFWHTGQVLFDDIDVYDPSIDVYALRKKIGMVFQRPTPFPMTIRKNVSYGPRLHGIKDEEELNVIVERSLKKAALWDEVHYRLDEPATNLSGGQQQRLCLARALAVEPEILLMDEPVSALDPISAKKIEELIMDLGEKYTILLVTHNVREAIRVSDFVAFLYFGELIEFGETRRIAMSPQNPETEEFIAGSLVECLKKV